LKEELFLWSMEELIEEKELAVKDWRIV